MKKLILLFALSLAACGGAPAEPESELGSHEQQLKYLDGGLDPYPELEVDSAPPPPPPSLTATCTNVTTDGVCSRLCCTETAGEKRCGVLPCPTTIVTGTVFTGTLFMK